MSNIYFSWDEVNEVKENLLQHESNPFKKIAIIQLFKSMKGKYIIEDDCTFMDDFFNDDEDRSPRRYNGELFKKFIKENK